MALDPLCERDHGIGEDPPDTGIRDLAAVRCLVGRRKSTIGPRERGDVEAHEALVTVDSAFSARIASFS